MQTVNVGQVNNTGVESSLAVHATQALSFYLNYSYQDEPDVEGVAKLPRPNGELILPLNVPPQHRFNLATVWDVPLYYANARVTYQDDAFWTDVFDARFWGPTDSFVAVNVGAGVRLYDDRIVWSVNGENIFDEDVQQHVFGDIIGRKVWSQVTYRF